MKAYKKNINKIVEIISPRPWTGRLGKIVGLRGDSYYTVFIYPDVGGNSFKPETIKIINPKKELTGRQFTTLRELLDLDGNLIKIGTKGRIVNVWREADFLDIKLEDGRETVFPDIRYLKMEETQ